MLDSVSSSRCFRNPHDTSIPNSFKIRRRAMAAKVQLCNALIARLCFKTQGAGLRAAARAIRCVVLHRHMSNMPASDALRTGSFARSRACGRLFKQSLTLSMPGVDRMLSFRRPIVFDVACTSFPAVVTSTAFRTFMCIANSLLWHCWPAMNIAQNLSAARSTNGRPFAERKATFYFP